ncbi:MAG: galactokinase [Defluviitaleaceae bacterium]|nr:galactokinase [Defluviitaleaceae bacterium]
MDTNELRNGYKRAFPNGGEPRFFYAPGRVNLIGEHIDYNGGYVFPCALTLGTYAAIAKRDDNIMRLFSANIKPLITVSTDNLEYNPEHRWANNPKAVTKLLMDMGHTLGGFDLYVWGNLPSNAGLSSSASINVLVAFALNTIYETGLDPIEIALLCQRAENEYLGVNCGIMDQFASAMGKKNHAILLNCNTLKYQYVPLELGDYRLILANTNKPRALIDSKYNERRAECEYALEILKKATDIQNLCEIDFEKFTEHSKKAFGEDTIKEGMTSASLSAEAIAFNRACHAISENDRVKTAVQALSKGDISTFGKLMTASHNSLRDFYEVTGAELDALVQAASDFKEMIGSRMTGAGFGGCTVSIVHKDKIEDFIKKVGQQYTKSSGLVADFYVAEVDDGAREIY